MPALQANPSDFLPSNTMLDDTIASWGIIYDMASCDCV
jgi:hypothetical protein